MSFQDRYNNWKKKQDEQREYNAPAVSGSRPQYYGSAEERNEQIQNRNEILQRIRTSGGETELERKRRLANEEYERYIDEQKKDPTDNGTYWAGGISEGEARRRVQDYDNFVAKYSDKDYKAQKAAVASLKRIANNAAAEVQRGDISEGAARRAAQRGEAAEREANAILTYGDQNVARDRARESYQNAKQRLAALEGKRERNSTNEWIARNGTDQQKREQNERNAEINDLRTEINLYERTQKVVDDYASYAEKEDFAENSQKGELKSPTEEYKEKAASGVGVMNDRSDESARASTFETLNDYEKGIYYYLKRRSGDEAAYKYLDDMKDETVKRHLDDFSAHVYESSPGEKVFWSAMSVPMNMVAGSAAFMGDVAGAATGNFNPYDAWNAGQNLVEGIRSSVGKSIEDNTDWEVFGVNIAKFGYDTALSMLDSSLGAATMGTAYTYIMGAGAAASEAKRLYDAGASGGQIIAGSLLAGTAEALFEEVSLERLLSEKSFSSKLAIIKDILAQGGVEASEEVFTEIANTITNTLVLGSQSDLMKAMKDYEAQGYTASEASARALMDKANDIFWAGAGGFVSGTGMGATFDTVNYHNQQVAYGNTGRQIREAGNTDALMEAARKRSEAAARTGEEFNARKNVRDTMTQVEKGGRQSKVDKAVGKLAGAVAQGYDAQTGAEMRSAIEARVRELDPGLSAGDAYVLSDAIMKATTGEKLTSAEKDILSGKTAGRVMSELTSQKNAGSMNRESIVTLATARLSQLGDKNAADTAQAIARYMNGEKLSATDTALLNSEAAQATVGLINAEKNRVYTNEWTSAIREAQARGKAQVQSVKEFTQNQNGREATATEVQNLESKAPSTEGMQIAENGADTGSVQVSDIGKGLADTTVTVDGKTVNAADTALSENAAAVIAYAVEGGLSSEAANMMLSVADTASNIDAFGSDFVTIARLVDSGMDAQSAFDRAQGFLNSAQRKMALAAGQAMRSKRIADSNRTLSTVTAAEGTVKITKGGKVTKQYTKQYGKNSKVGQAMRLIQVLADVSGIDFVVFNSSKQGISKDANGQIVRDKDTGRATIWVDTESGVKADSKLGIREGQQAMLTTLAHEVTHLMEKDAAAEYEVLKNFLFDELNKYDKKTVSKMIEKKEADGFKGEEAVSEVVAELCEDMLQDGSALRRLAESDMQTFAKLKAYIDNWLDKLLQAFGKAYGRHSAEMRIAQVDIKKMQELWNNAFVAAVTNYRNSPGVGGDFASVTDSKGESMLSTRTMAEDYDRYKQLFLDYDILSEEQYTNLFATIDHVVNVALANREILDFGWDIETEHRPYTPIKPNSDPLYVFSLDMSTICRKRMLQQIITDKLSQKLIEQGRSGVVSKEMGIAIRQELVNLRNEGKKLEVACALCYVESARMKSPKVIDAFLSNRRAEMTNYFAKQSPEVKAMIAKAVEDFKVGRLYDPKATKKDMSPKDAAEMSALTRKLRENAKLTAEQEQIVQDCLDLPNDMFTTSKGLQKLAEEYPQVYGAFTQKIANASRSKGVQTDMPFAFGDTKPISDTMIANMNRENGIRTQSWSDFQVFHILDYIAATMEFASRGAKMHAYTKVPDYVNLMGETRTMINLSLIPAAKWTGKLEFDPYEGMAFDVAMELRERFPETVGTIAIGINDEQTRALLADDRIDYVIPYHASGMSKATRELMDIPQWVDATKKQTEHKKDYPTTKHDANYQKKINYSDWFDLDIAKRIAAEKGGQAAMQAMAKRYIDLCHERGFEEKFHDLVGEAGYWKLLVDRKMINQKTGMIIEQMPVLPLFDVNRIDAMMQNEVKRWNEVNADMKYAEEYVINKALNEELDVKKAKAEAKKIEQRRAEQIAMASAGEVKQSIRDSDGNELSPGQVEYFKDSKVRDENGKLMVVYHGSQNEFTVFDGRGNSQFGKYKFGDYIVNYFTTSKSTAEDFSRNEIGEFGNVLKGYVNIKNPYMFVDEAENEYGYSTSSGMKNRELRKFEISLFDGLYDIMKTCDTVDELNEYLFPFNAYAKDYGKDSEGDRYEIFTAGGNALFANEDFVTSANDIWDMFDDEELLKERILGISEEYGDDDYYYSTDRVAKLILAMNEWGGKNYDGIIIDNIFDAMTFHAEVATDVVTLESSNQFKNADNLNPTESDDIRYSSRDKDEMADTAESHFGVTNNMKECGYITINGKALDFSGRHRGGTNIGSRQVDHADVAEILPEDFDTYAIIRSGANKGEKNRSGSMAMWEFLKYGNIRTQPEAGSIELAMMPTEAQQSKLKQYLNATRKVGEQTVIDLDDLNSEGRINPVAALRYDASTSSDAIILDITEYYKTGKLPEGVSKFGKAVQWNFSQREKSDREILLDALESGDTTETEKRTIRNIKGNIDKVNDLETQLATVKESLKAAKTNAEKSALRAAATNLEAQITKIDKRIASLETMAPMKNLVEREKRNAGAAARAAAKERIVKTRADDRAKLKAAVDKERAKRAEAVAGVKAEYRDRISNLRSEKNARIEEEYRAGIEKAQKIREGHKMTDLRRNIKERKANFEKMLTSPTEKKFVPIRLVETVVTLCDMIDDNTSQYNRDGTLNQAQARREKMAAKVREVAAYYEDVLNSKDDGSYYFGEFDEGIKEQFDEIAEIFGSKNLNDMTLQELTLVDETLRIMNAQIKGARKLIRETGEQNVAEVGQAIIDEQNAMRKSRNPLVKAIRDGKLAVDAFMLSPLRYVDMIAGYGENSELSKLYDELNQGVRKADEFMMRAHKAFEPLTTGKNRKLFDDAVNKAVELKVGGRTYSATKMQLMEMVMDLQRETSNDETQHIANGGVVLANPKLIAKGKVREAADKNGGAVRIIGDEAVQACREAGRMLANDDWCQKYMQTARELFDGTAKDAINEATRQVLYRDVATSKNYIKYTVDKDLVRQEINGNNSLQQTLIGNGSLKALTKGAANPLVIRGLNEVVEEQIDFAGRTTGLLVPVRNFNKVWNVFSGDTSVRESIDDNYGKKALNTLEQIVRDVQSRRPSNEDAVSQMFKRFTGAFAESVLSGNISVMIKQAASLDTAFAYLRFRPTVKLAADFAKTAVKFKEITAEIDAHTAQHYKRRIGLTTQEIGSMTEHMTRARKAINSAEERAKILNVIDPTKWIQYTDCVTTAVFWDYCKKDIEHSGKYVKGSDQYWKAVTDLYDKVIEDTQPMYDVLHRPEALRTTNALTRAVTMFKTQPFQNYNTLMDAIGRFSANRSGANAKKLGKAVESQMKSALTFTAMTLFAKALLRRMNPYKDDDDEITAESIAKEMLSEYLNTMSGVIATPYATDIESAVSALVERWQGKGNYYGNDLVSVGVVDFVNDFWNAVGKLAEKKDAATAKELAVQLAGMSGIPAQNLINIFEGITGWVGAAKDAETIGDMFSFSSGTSTQKDRVKRFVRTYSEGDAAKAKADLDAYIAEKAQEKLADKQKEYDEADDAGKQIMGEYTEKDAQADAKSAVKTAITEYYKEMYQRAWIAGADKKLEEIKAALRATGLYELPKDTDKWVKGLERRK